ncbi:hypothetical protein GXW74_05510 [Roseomonas eburnea]|uniref:Putative adhesin Stv domain-containing protein n=1 Tax=Neoroseomonas eburnea TaxID=1346889 RepID=A0A9X9X899_9PROT|nr:hypothetical protein [Neoroseomonas eburnea]MBR0679935.1 hypothetical protein [Neoroseomonas eburnea]
MTGVVVTGHGGRGPGTSFGTYLVPPGVTIYFFTRDGQLLNSEASDPLMDLLCRQAPDEATVRAAATEVKTAYSTIPNYVCFGTNDFRDPSGVYLVGEDSGAGLVIPVPDGSEKRLSDIIGGGSSGGAIADEVYWLCCRDKPGITNNPDITVATTWRDAAGRVLTLGGDIGPSPMGLTPSQVRRTGRWI